jgi:uncharacterized DUF497 family protein
MIFEWDKEKNDINIVKHGIDFNDAAGVFGGPYLELYDAGHSADEDRFIAVGNSHGVTMVVVYTERKRKIRIISARKATKHEEAGYWNKLGKA